MKFKKQKHLFSVNRIGGDDRKGGSSKHGPLLPSSIRAIMSGPSGCGKTNVMHALITEPHGLRFANLYIFSKSLTQPKYVLLKQIMDNVPEIGYYASDSSEQCGSVAPNSVLIFDDVICDSQNPIKEYYSMGRHQGIDCFYLAQTYTRIPKHLLRDNANLLIVFKQDELNLKHIYEEHVNTDMSFNAFKELCNKCWNTSKYSFLVIDKESELQKGRYRCGFDTFISDL